MGPPAKRKLVKIADLIGGMEDLLDYYFFNHQLCQNATENAKERRCLATLPSLPEFSSVKDMAAAACKSGLEELLYEELVDKKTLVVTVNALLGAVLEDVENEGEMLEAAACLGVDPVQQIVRIGEGDLLGVEEFWFVQRAASVPIVESLI
ncbi:uncharacterized protein M421DRAFT_2781 [Didymella exigua CBS 183.55]|uniref:Uncharacterized protein n=1 Tax=Didymella exigua CBS 183.55 TaxID=1150837 RepID=A0A6A5RS53_9PLEO|nr:uncharacterized protein M421DRAFT_2781 [Didymella exigua CBS 183.55]KAF1931271.1 hypothetical protein M421DRAFT_2781 [Didymella exigua CBS 183.55]